MAACTEHPKNRKNANIIGCLKVGVRWKGSLLKEVIETDIKPIETYYNGYRFRSRLEARWAVFFDAGKIKYEYEPEGFDINGTRYLPDFYLSDLDIYVEVKRDTAEGIEEVKTKCAKAITWGGPIKQLLILSDIPEGKSPDGGIWHFPVVYWNTDSPNWGWFFFHDGEDDEVIGQVSGANYISSWHYIEGRKKASISAKSDCDLRCKNFINAQEVEDWISFQEAVNEKTFDAFKKARKARFEHGEKPII